MFLLNEWMSEPTIQGPDVEADFGGENDDGENSEREDDESDEC